MKAVLRVGMAAGFLAILLGPGTPLVDGAHAISSTNYIVDEKGNCQVCWGPPPIEEGSSCDCEPPA